MTGGVNADLDIVGVLDRPLGLGKSLFWGDIDVLPLDGLKGILGLSSRNIQSFELVAHTKRDVLGFGH